VGQEMAVQADPFQVEPEGQVGVVWQMPLER